MKFNERQNQRRQSRDPRTRGGRGPDGDAPQAATRTDSDGGWPLRKLMLVAAAAVVVGVGALFSLGGGQDNVSEQETASRQAGYQSFVAGGGLPVAMVSPERVDEAVATMNLSQEQRAALKQDVESGRMLLAWLTMWDTHAEDGDVLRFESDSSYPVEVRALNSKTTIAIPYPASGTVKVVGVVDGGGGITIALESGATRIAWPTMRPGDSLDLPVTPGF